MLGRRALVAAQVGLAVMIVAGAGLLTRSLLKLQATDLGLSADRLVFIDLVPSPKFRDPAYHSRFLDELVVRLESTPVIAAATPVNVPPFSGLGGWDVPRFTSRDRPQPKRRRIRRSTSNRFTPTTSRHSRFASCGAGRSQMRIEKAR